MIQPITKLVTISPLLDHEQQRLRLDTVDGRFSIAEQLQKDIDEWCKQAFDDGPRTHLGASIIGNECDRATWYTFRWFKHKIHSARMYRLFQDGHWYEERFIEMLRGIGCQVHQVTEDGEQHHIYAVQGHFGGSTDGAATLPERYGLIATLGEFLLEFKTINTSGFSSFHDVQHSKPQHWGQMCVYGVKRGLRYAIYIIVNKNDSDMYIEVAELDWELGNRLIQKGEHIIYSTFAPPKLSQNPSDYRCKMCDYHKLCQMREVAPDVNCRSCKHSSPIDNKEWYCNQWNSVIPSKQAMIKGCQAYELLSGE